MITSSSSGSSRPSAKKTMKRTMFLRAMRDARGAASRPNDDSKTNEPLRGVRRPKGRETPKDRKMTKDEMIEWFNAAPEGSRHQRTLWAARKIARLTGATDGGAYRALLIALIEAERLPWDHPRGHRRPM